MSMVVDSFAVKRVAVIAIALCISLSATAQLSKGDKSVGVNVLSGFYGDDLVGIGIGANFAYNFADPFRLAGELDFSFGVIPDVSDVYFGIQDFSLYGHYLFHLPSENVTVYPLVGIGTFNVKMSVVGESLSVSERRTVYSLGAGFEGGVFKNAPNLKIRMEVRLKLHDGSNHFIIPLGIVYKF